MLSYQPEFRSKVFLKHTLRSYGISGVVCHLKEPNMPFFETLVKAEIPHILLNFDGSEISANTLNINNFRGGHIAGKTLGNYGHESIGIIYRPSYHDDMKRVQGCKEGIMELGGHVTWMAEDHLDHDEPVRHYIEQLDQFTAIFSTNYISSFKILKISKELNKEIPKHFSLISFGDYDFTPHINPALTALRLPVKQIAIAAVEQFMLMIKGQQNKRVTLSIEPELMIRDSIKSFNLIARD